MCAPAPSWTSQCNAPGEWDAAVADGFVEPRALPRDTSAIVQQLEVLASALARGDTSEAERAEALFRRYLKEFDAFVAAIVQPLGLDGDQLELLARWHCFLRTGSGTY